MSLIGIFQTQQLFLIGSRSRNKFFDNRRAIKINQYLSVCNYFVKNISVNLKTSIFVVYICKISQFYIDVRLVMVHTSSALMSFKKISRTLCLNKLCDIQWSPKNAHKGKNYFCVTNLFLWYFHKLKLKIYYSTTSVYYEDLGTS